VTFDDAELADLHIPTLFIVGTEDEIFPPASIAEAARRLPAARVDVIEGAGHSPYFEQGRAWNDLVAAFWRECP
jgi:3-oxoadipate enol-lactonase